MFSFIWFFVFEFLIDKIYFFIFLIFLMFIVFHSFKNIFDVITILNNNFVNIEMWSNDELIFDFVLQCFILLISLFDMNIKSVMFWKFLAFQIIVFCERIHFMFVSFIISINWFVMTCCVNLDDLFQNEWCKLNSFNKMWFVSIFFTHSFMIDNVFSFFGLEQGNRGEKKRDAGFRISHLAKRNFFQSPFSHEKREIFLGNLPSHMWKEKRSFLNFPSHMKKNQEKTNFYLLIDWFIHSSFWHRICRPHAGLSTSVYIGKPFGKKKPISFVLNRLRFEALSKLFWRISTWCFFLFVVLFYFDMSL